jgi:hypothetical protein
MPIRIELKICAFLKFLLVFTGFLFAQTLLAHGHHAHDDEASLKNWQVSSQKQPFQASFLMFKNGEVFLETANDAVVHFPLADFSEGDQNFVREKIAQIEQLNQSKMAAQQVQSPENRPIAKSNIWLWSLVLLAFALGAGFLFFTKSKKLALALSLGGTAFLFAFKTEIGEKMLGTDPLFMDAAFQPFKPNVATHWDGTWFYVESNGIPTTHPMMAGITKWQQQVPIQQCYLGANAWQIPLNPVLAAQPVPVNPQHFLRGAVAIAANGIPIFNPYTNTGVDAFLDGQLDQWGGHCGRADDYHYHIAPMFLDTQSVDILPIAFALDGFAVYAGLEPDGSPMLPLDANHGHFDGAGVYHYHGTAAAPYMIGNMVGKVTEDATMQIIPQSKATPVRPSLTPLNGATITNCSPKPAGNGYTLTYTKGGETFKVDYDWTAAGKYTYHFIAPTGTTTETYNGHLPCEVPVSTTDFLNKKLDVTVFPNPTSGSISLKINDLKAKIGGSIQIFDAGGKLVFEKENVNGQLEINGLARGVYFLKAQLEGGQWTKKLIVQ